MVAECGAETDAREVDEEDEEGAAIAVKVQTLSGDICFDATLPGSASVTDLVAQMDRHLDLLSQNCKCDLIHGTNIITADLQAKLRDVLETPAATLGLLVTPLRYKLAAKDIGDPEKQNEYTPGFVQRECQDTPEEYLRLKPVRQFHLGGTFQNVRPGSYELLLETAKTPRFTLRGHLIILINGEPVNEEWNPSDEITEHFQSCSCGAEFELHAANDVSVVLTVSSGGWLTGLLWRAIRLRIIR